MCVVPGWWHSNSVGCGIPCCKGCLAALSQSVGAAAGRAVLGLGMTSGSRHCTERAGLAVSPPPAAARTRLIINQVQRQASGV